MDQSATRETDLISLPYPLNRQALQKKTKNKKQKTKNKKKKKKKKKTITKTITETKIKTETKTITITEYYNMHKVSPFNSFSFSCLELRTLYDLSLFLLSGVWYYFFSFNMTKSAELSKKLQYQN